jgi:hypothetical protein
MDNGPLGYLTTSVIREVDVIAIASSHVANTVPAVVEHGITLYIIALFAVRFDVLNGRAALLAQLLPTITALLFCLLLGLGGTSAVPSALETRRAHWFSAASSTFALLPQLSSHLSLLDPDLST